MYFSRLKENLRKSILCFCHEAFWDATMVVRLGWKAKFYLPFFPKIQLQTSSPNIFLDELPNSITPLKDNTILWDGGACLEPQNLRHIRQISEFKAILVHRASSRVAKDKKVNPISKHRIKQEQNTTHEANLSPLCIWVYSKLSLLLV